MEIPAHIAVIMDGNGRWAKERGMARIRGHNAGMNAVTRTVRACSDRGVKYLTVYAFSTENWKRPAEEVSGIFRLLVVYVSKKLRELHENNVRMRILGDTGPLPGDCSRALEEAVELTKDNTGMVLSIALNYGGRAEVIRAARALAAKAIAGEIEAQDIDEESFSRELYTADMPDPDLVIRKGGEFRLSNFLTWQSAYSELYFTDVYWPDFTPEELDRAIEAYGARSRRFGGLR